GRFARRPCWLAVQRLRLRPQTVNDLRAHPSGLKLRVSSREWRGRPIGPLGRLAKARGAWRQLLLQRGRSLTQRSSFGTLAQADDWVGSLLLSDRQDGRPRSLAGLEGGEISGL